MDVRFVVLLLLSYEEPARPFILKSLHLINPLTEIDDTGASKELDVRIDLLKALCKSDSFIPCRLDIIDEYEPHVMWT